MLENEKGNCEYFKLEEKKRRVDKDVSQTPCIGTCSHEKGSEQAVSCYGLVEFCQLSCIGEKIKLA